MGDAAVTFFEDGLFDVPDVVIELVGGAGAGGALVVDEKLFEIPLAVGDLGDAGLPGVVGAGLEAGDGPAADELGLAVGGEEMGIAILRFEDKGGFEVVDAGCDMDLGGENGIVSCGTQAADGVAGAG